MCSQMSSQASFFNNLNFYRKLNCFWCFIGLLLCIYTLHVEYSIENQRNYQPFCEINPNINCSHVFMSKWSKSFGLLQDILGEQHWLILPNPIFAIAFYLFQLVLCEFVNIKTAFLQLFLSILANLATVWLAYILIQLSNVCLVCVSSYLVNLILLYIHIKKYCIFKNIKIVKSTIGTSFPSSSNYRNKRD
ncbi:vitamin K epoxide reductase complex subunit 1-like protein 1 [Gordionus sp. m RMFG-2023]|uniref:vitamin K epoxide reductase complex subunit 1-like protein 1 n=1 Tax=Gordionus sp. m RMFG-2023 TaxID=3053472 RepID=UPI0031FC5489